MALYLVSRNDEVDYDEYDSFVVRAKNEEEAILICSDDQFRKDNTTIEKLEEKGKSEIILGSYNAG